MPEVAAMVHSMIWKSARAVTTDGNHRDAHLIAAELHEHSARSHRQIDSPIFEERCSPTSAL